MSRITEAFREARLAANVRQGDLAKTLGITQGFLSDIERGRRELPRQHYAKLPAPIRLAVVKAWIDGLREELAEAREMMRDARKHGDTSG